MIIAHLIELIANLQCPAIPSGLQQGFPGHSFTAIGAAFATQGYWVQSDILDMLTRTTLGLWAPLIYLIAAIGGLIGLALGTPPRTYLWFFMGPAIYGWLVDSRQEVRGVRWVIPCSTPQDLISMQREVWKLAEVGLANSHLARRLSNSFSTVNVVDLNGPNRNVSVAMPFLWFDSLLSSTVSGLITWTGISRISAVQNQNNTNIAFQASDYQSVANSTDWALYADMKWSAMEEITSATLDNEDLRDAFASFFVWCGDRLREAGREEALVAAAATNGVKLPQTVFVCSGDCDDGAPRLDYAVPREILTANVPFPDSLKSFLNGRSTAGFWYALVPGQSAAPVGDWARRDTLTCDEFLTTLMLGFRFEAEHRYIKFYETVMPAGITDPQRNEDLLVASLLYGWDIKRNRSAGNGANLTKDEQKQFVRDLILLHLVRNELQLAPQLIKVRQGSVEKLTGFIQQAQRTTVSKNKYSELYSWSLMLPYVQGTLLYLLAVAYPFACILVVVPGWHKTVFTWMSFWTWVKLWDLGFAIVKSIEKSVWAMTGLDSNAAALSDRIVGVATQVGIAGSHQCLAGSQACPIQRFKLNTPSGAVDYGATTGINFEDESNSAWRLLDIGMTVQKSLDFDLANAYYIYIMAGLYFAVPAATGQLILGARAGAAGMVNSLISGVASESARGATGGFQSELASRAKSNNMSVGQAAQAKPLADQGLALQSLGYSIAGAEQSMAQAELSAMNGALSRQGQGFGASAEQRAKALNVASSGALALTSGVQGFHQSIVTATNDAGALQRHQQLLNALGGASGGGGSGGGSGPGGGAPANQPPSSGVTGPGIGSSVGQVALASARDVIGHAGAWNAFHSGGDNLEANKQLGMQSQANDIAAFRAGQTANQLGIAGRNMDRHADFSAQSAAWQTRNAFANQVNGLLAASGLPSALIDPGQKPTDQVGLAMSGMLGDAARNAAWHMDYNRGGFGQRIAATSSALNRHYGSNAIGDAYRSWGIIEATQATIGGGWQPQPHIPTDSALGPTTPK